MTSGVRFIITIIELWVFNNNLLDFPLDFLIYIIFPGTRTRSELTLCQAVYVKSTLTVSSGHDLFNHEVRLDFQRATGMHCGWTE